MNLHEQIFYEVLSSNERTFLFKIRNALYNNIFIFTKKEIKNLNKFNIITKVKLPEENKEIYRVVLDSDFISFDGKRVLNSYFCRLFLVQNKVFKLNE